jgi:hypothetical protein
MQKPIVPTLLCALFSALPAFCAAFGSTTAWDVQTGGSNTNGGAFDSGVASPGTDKSEGSPTAFTDLVAATTTATSVTLAFSSASPGNFIHVASGSGCNTGWFEILSQAAGTATFNATLGTGTCTGTAYGPLLTVGQANGNVVSGNTVWIKTGSYAVASVITLPNTHLTFEGYGSTHGDLGTQPVLTSGSSNVFNTSETGAEFINLGIASSAGSESGIQLLGGEALVYLCTFNMPATSSGIYNNDGVDYAWLIANTFEGAGNGVDDAGGNYPQLFMIGNLFKATGNCFWDNNSSTNRSLWFFQSNVFSGCAYGIYVQNTPTWPIMLEGNVFYNSVNDGVNIRGGASSVTPILNVVYNNVFYGNGGYGLNLANAQYTNFVGPNAYGSNTSGNYNNFVAGTGDVPLTANPFTSGTVFTLNSTTGGGALLKAAAFPGVTPAGTGYLDIGALQSKAASGGSSPHAYVQ